MKKTLSILMVLIVCLSMVFAGGDAEKGADTRNEIQKAIDAANGMTLAELEAAAKAEFEAAGVKFVAQSSTSGVGKALTKFKENYAWFDFEEFSSVKDSAAYTALSNTVANGNFWADLALLQEGASFLEYYDEELIYSFNPKDDSIKLTDDERSPLTILYGNKLFTYNKENYTKVKLENVWQLTGKDGATLKAMEGGVSMQDPTNEAINMSFIVMMTSPDACKRLESAYKAYFGKDYVKQEGFDNIGYFFVSEFLQNVKNRHTSDSKVSSDSLPADTAGFVYVIGLNKMKSYKSTHGGKWQDEVYVSGVDNHLAGFDGFTYKFFAGIPKTCRLPYTACLFSRYLLTAEGFKAGWKDPGYYSANAANPLNADYDMSSADRLQYTLIEDPDYIADNSSKVDSFVRKFWN